MPEPEPEDPIAAAILEDDRLERLQLLQASRRWVPWMKPMFLAGAVSSVVSAAILRYDRRTHYGIQPGVLLAIAVVPALVNFLASYAIRHGSVARPNGYPVRFRGRSGRWVNGANLALAGAVLFSVIAGVEVWDISDG
jgi:hypothetical protein